MKKPEQVFVPDLIGHVLAHDQVMFADQYLFVRDWGARTGQTPVQPAMATCALARVSEDIYDIRVAASKSVAIVGTARTIAFASFCVDRTHTS